jgi:hypothetical protein
MPCATRWTPERLTNECPHALSLRRRPCLTVREPARVRGFRQARRWCTASFFHGAGRKAGPGGRIGLGQDGHGTQPAAAGAGCQPEGRPTARLEGRDLLSLPERELRGMRGRDIAMIFQEPMTALNPLMTVGDQIAEVLAAETGSGPFECAQNAIELIADTGIAEPHAAHARTRTSSVRRAAPAGHDRHGAGLPAPNCCWPTNPPRRWM